MKHSYFYLCFVLLSFACSKNEENLPKAEYLMTEINYHDGVTDDILFIDEVKYDAEDKLILIKKYSTRSLSDIDRKLFKYNELNELISIRAESAGGVFYELEVTKEKGEIVVKGWDQPHKMVFYYNEDNMITKKEVWYNSSSPNVFNFSYNSENQLIKFEQNIGSLATKIITYDDYVDLNSFPFPVYIGTFGELEFIISHAFNLKLGMNGVPTTSNGYSEFKKFEYDFDKNKNISKMYLNINNVFSFKYKEKEIY